MLTLDNQNSGLPWSNLTVTAATHRYCFNSTEEGTSVLATKGFIAPFL